MYIKTTSDADAPGVHAATAVLSSAPQYQPGDLLVGGGAQTGYTGAGQLLTKSFPLASGAWAAESKDHAGLTSSGVLSVSVIGMRRCPAGTNRCFNSKISTDPPAGAAQSTGYWSVFSNPLSGRVTTSVGAKIDYNGVGRMLTQLFPETTFGYGGTTATFKDHTIVDSGTAFAYTVSLGDTFDPL